MRHVRAEDETGEEDEPNPGLDESAIEADAEEDDRPPWLAQHRLAILEPPRRPDQHRCGDEEQDAGEDPSQDVGRRHGREPGAGRRSEHGGYQKDAQPPPRHRVAFLVTGDGRQIREEDRNTIRAVRHVDPHQFGEDRNCDC